MTERLLPPGIDDPIDRATLSDGAVDRIKASIMSGSMKPGEGLDQTTLARKLGISRMPVRDALRQLEREGFVQVDSRGFASVVDLDVHEVGQVYEIREAVETLAARLAAPRVTDEDVGLATRLVREMDDAVRAGDRTSFLQSDHDFHLAAYSPCGNPRLMKIISELVNATWSYRIAVVSPLENLDIFERGHIAMAEALAQRDGERLAMLTRQHLQVTVEKIGRTVRISEQDRHTLVEADVPNSAVDR